MTAPLPNNELERLAALRRTELLDSLPEQVFDDVVQLAALICGTPIALISLVDERRQWFKARVGLDATETARDVAFCSHAILQPDEMFIVGDALADQRFATNPLVTADPHIRFYAGAPITDAQGLALGTVCAIDRQPRELSAAQLKALQALSRQVSKLIEWRQQVAQDRRALNDKLQEERARIFQATAIATQDLALKVYVDREHVIRYVNDCFLRYRRLTRGQVEGRHVREVLGELPYEQKERQRLDQALAGTQLECAETIEYPELGARRMMLTHLPVRDAHGQVCAVVVRVQDVHEVEQARQELAKTNEQLTRRNAVQTRFLHMVSHDLREPVNSIVNFAGMLSEDLDERLDALSRRHLGFIRQGGERMRALLDDLLDYVHLEDQDGIALHRQRVDLQEVIQEVLLDLDGALRKEQAVIEPGHLPCVLGDRTLLRVLLQNLLSNALKFHAPGLPPRVAWGSTSVQDGGCQIWVRDHGIGIAPHLVPKLFGAFSRLVTRREFTGTGLGLAISKRITELHGGRIELVSLPGQGSTFSVWFPPAAMNEESPS
ncbi:PAS domain S-box [Burkholderiales bacterium JOSHI_001]|nr:PAS domain S-box [Burkholderiales bacterium JOSHI_001]